MALVKCRKCKKEISKKAKVCPHCGVKDPGLTKLDLLLGTVFLIGICFAVYFWAFGEDKSSDIVETANKTLTDYKKEPVINKQKIVSNFIVKNKIDKSYGDAFYNCVSQKSYTWPTDMKLDDILGFCQVDFTRDPKKLNNYVNLDTFMSGFSGWDGSYRPLEKMIQKTMHDDSSYKHVKTIYQLVLNQKSPYAIVDTTFKGTNTYGGVVTSTVTAKIDLKTGKPIELIE
jgi:hypothetical protein